MPEHARAKIILGAVGEEHKPFPFHSVDKGLANRQIHCFTVRGSVAKSRPAVVLAAIRAIGAAQKSIHASQKDTVEVLARAFPTRDRRELETIVRLYEPAIPETPDVHVEDIGPALALFPDGLPKPDLSAVDLTQYVAVDLAPKARAEGAADDGGARGRMIAILVAIGTVLALVVGVLTARRKPERP